MFGVEIEIPPEFTSLLTLVEQIVLGVHENRSCNHDVPQRFYTADDKQGKKEEVSIHIFF